MVPQASGLDRAIWLGRDLGCSGLVAALAGTGHCAAASDLGALLLVVGGIVVVVTLVQPQLGVLLIVPAVPFGSLRQVSVGVMNVGADRGTGGAWCWRPG